MQHASQIGSWEQGKGISGEDHEIQLNVWGAGNSNVPVLISWL